MQNGNFADAQLRALIDVAAAAAGAHRLQDVLELAAERALEALGAEPERSLFVGDRLYEDVRGASEVGMTTVQALWFRADEHPEGGEPDYQAFTQLDVLNVVRRLG